MQKQILSDAMHRPGEVDQPNSQNPFTDNFIKFVLPFTFRKGGWCSGRFYKKHN